MHLSNLSPIPSKCLMCNLSHSLPTMTLSLSFLSLNWFIEAGVYGCKQCPSFEIYDPDPQQTQLKTLNVSFQHLQNICQCFRGWNVSCVLSVSCISSYSSVCCPIKTKDSGERKNIIMVLNHLANLCVKGWKDNLMYSGGGCQGFRLIKNLRLPYIFNTGFGEQQTDTNCVCSIRVTLFAK